MCGKLYRVMEKGISIIAVIMTGLLFFSNFLGTAYVEDMASQIVLVKWDNLFLGLSVLVLVLGIGLFLDKKNINIGKHKNKLLIFTMLWYLGIDFFVIVFGKSAPSADAASVYWMSRHISNGNLSMIHASDSYLSYYPQQIGLSTFLAVLMRLIRIIPIAVEEYHFIKIVYVILLCITVYFASKIIDRVWKNDNITCIYLLLCILNLPMILYTSFIYGEVPAYCAFIIGVYFMIKCFEVEKLSIINPVFSIFFMTMSVWLRKNMLIMIIGVLIIYFGQFLHTHKKRWLAYGLLCLVFSVSILNITESMYENAAGQKINDGVTVLSYLAMGMQESERGPGWYNGFNFNTYLESDMNAEVANEVSMLAIQERLEDFAERPFYAMQFYAGKFFKQWADGTYASREAVLGHCGGRHPFFWELYTGKYSSYLIAFCNQVQNIVYLGGFLWSLLMYKKVRVEKNGYLLSYLGIIIIFGGLLFHMMWEASARYILLYGQILYFYAAVGWFAVGKIALNKYKNWKKANK